MLVDLRSDDSPEPIGDLERMLDLHDLYFGSTPDEDLLLLEGPLVGELEERLAATGYRSGDVIRDLYDWMGRENSRSAGATASSIRSLDQLRRTRRPSLSSARPRASRSRSA